MTRINRTKDAGPNELEKRDRDKSGIPPNTRYPPRHASAFVAGDARVAAWITLRRRFIDKKPAPH
jgi:hypothetical protein